MKKLFTRARLRITSLHFLCVSLAYFTSICSIGIHLPCSILLTSTTWSITTCPFFPFTKFTMYYEGQEKCAMVQNYFTLEERSVFNDIVN